LTNPRIKNREKNYISTNRVINKTREEFKSELFNYARSNFSNQIEDFSDASLGGMILDFAAIVGESLSFYVEQQFNELDYETSFSDYSLVNHLRKAGVNSGNASPSSAFVNFTIEVNVDQSDSSSLKASSLYLPIIKKGTTLSSSSGIMFVLEEDVDFNKSYNVVMVSERDNSNNATSVIIEKEGLCTSGEIVEETFAFPEDNTSFLSYTLSNDNVTKVYKISDTEENEYFEVEFLSQDTIYTKISNSKDNFFTIKPAIFRYIREENFDSGFTTIRFGNGTGKTFEDGIFTNPEDLTLPILGRDYINRRSIDPKNLLKSDSLGVSPSGKVLSFKYKHGGGIDHNVPSESIDNYDNLIITYPNVENQDVPGCLTVTNSVGILNKKSAVGGTSGITLEELREQIPIARKMQSRIVNHEDLLSRIYTMPSNFGKIHKATIIENQYTKVSKDLYIICKDNNGFYISANDAIKINLSNFLNEYRLIGDSLNIIDSPVFNFSIYIKVKVSPNYIVIDVLDSVKASIFNQMRFETMQIGQGINVNDIVSIALNTPGVLTINSSFKNIIRSKSEKDDAGVTTYNKNIFAVFEKYEDGIVYPPRGGIFELKYADFDIVIANS
jgi:hypothetical protein